MPRIVIKDVRPFDGEYEFDIQEEPLTTLEWRWVKKISGYLPLTFRDGLRGADPDLFCAFAVIALHRAGKIEREDAIQTADKLADAPFDGAAIQIINDEDDGEQEGEERPPDQPPVTG